MWLYHYDPGNKTQSKQLATTGWKWSNQSKIGAIKGKGDGNRFWGYAKHFACWFPGELNYSNICILWKCFQEVSWGFNNKKRLGKLHQRLLFHHDNAPAHASRQMWAILRQNADFFGSFSHKLFLNHQWLQYCYIQASLWIWYLFWLQS